MPEESLNDTVVEEIVPEDNLNVENVPEENLLPEPSQIDNITEEISNITEKVENINEQIDNITEQVENVVEEVNNTSTEVIEVIDQNNTLNPEVKALLKAEKEKNEKEEKNGKKEKKEEKEEKKGKNKKKKVEVTESIDDIINEVNDTLNGTVFLELDNESKSGILSYIFGIFIILCFVGLIIIGTQYQKFAGKYNNDYQNESLTNYLLLDSIKKDDDYPSVTNF